MPSSSSGADPDELMECVRERCLVIESRLNRDLDQQHAGLAHQFFRVVNHGARLISTDLPACLRRRLSDITDRIAKGLQDVKKSVRAAEELP